VAGLVKKSRMSTTFKTPSLSSKIQKNDVSLRGGLGGWGGGVGESVKACRGNVRAIHCVGASTGTTSTFTLCTERSSGSREIGSDLVQVHDRR